MANINNIDGKRQNRNFQTIKTNIHPIDNIVSQKIAVTFSTIIQKIKERHL
jgi:hypothetical protein